MGGSRSMHLKVPTIHTIGFGLVALVLILQTVPAEAQYCMNYVGSSMLDNSTDCRAMPEIDRTFYTGTVHWNDNELLIHSTGNDLSIWNIQNPAHPKEVSNSDFQVGNLGDSDYDLLSWTACDDCRFGVATFKLGAVAFDLGTEDLPSFQTFQVHTQYPQLDRPMTFSHRGHQYLVAKTLQNACDGGAGLFHFSGTDLDSLILLECLEGSGGATVPSKGGLYLQSPGLNDGTAYLWLQVGPNVHIFRVEGDGDGLNLTFVASPDGMFTLSTAGLAVDLRNKVAATAGLKIWQVLSLENPVHVGSLAVEGDIVSLAYPLVWLAQFGQTSQYHSSHTVDISDPSAPQLRDDQFWSGDNPWNQPPCWGGELGGVFSEDGSYLFLSRWERLQQFDFRQCLGDPSIIFVSRFELGDTSEWSMTIN